MCGWGGTAESAYRSLMQVMLHVACTQFPHAPFCCMRNSFPCPVKRRRDPLLQGADEHLQQLPSATARGHTHLSLSNHPVRQVEIPKISQQISAISTRLEPLHEVALVSFRESSQCLPIGPAMPCRSEVSEKHKHNTRAKGFIILCCERNLRRDRFKCYGCAPNLHPQTQRKTEAACTGLRKKGHPRSL